MKSKIEIISKRKSIVDKNRTVHVPINRGTILGISLSREDILNWPERNGINDTISFYANRVNQIARDKNFDEALHFSEVVNAFLSNKHNKLNESERESISESLDTFIDITEKYFGDYELLAKLCEIKNQYIALDDVKQSFDKIEKYKSLHRQLINGEYNFKDDELLPPMKIVDNFLADSKSKYSKILKENDIKQDYYINMLCCITTRPYE